MIDVVDVSQDEVVEDDFVLLKDVTEILMHAEVMIDDEGLDVELDICPADDVLLLNDDIIKNNDVLLMRRCRCPPMSAS